MKTKKKISLIFGMLLAFAVVAYFLVQLAFRAKNASIPNDVGKIKYVDGSGNEIFASASAVMFSLPIQVSDITIENNVAHIKAQELELVRSPAMGVVKFAQNGRVEIEHGNSTYSVISGITTLGVKEGDYIFSGDPIGTSESEIEFSVTVSDLPLNMKWLIESFGDNENTK